MVSSGAADVRVHPSEEPWFGMTYRADRARVEAHIAELVQQGEYPKSLRHAMRPVDPRVPETDDDRDEGSPDQPVEDDQIIGSAEPDEPVELDEPDGSEAPAEPGAQDGSEDPETPVTPETPELPGPQDWIG
jgi:hypothetical protein